MIVIFPNEDVNLSNFLPKEQFTIVRSLKDVYDKKLDGVIMMPNWQRETTDDVMCAFNYLKTSYNELFKNE